MLIMLAQGSLVPEVTLLQNTLEQVKQIIEFRTQGSSMTLTGFRFFGLLYFTGHLTLKVDVYSFGVVLLQILSGYGAVKKFTDGTTGNLVQWAEPRFSQLRIDSLVDEALGNNFPMEEARRFAELTQQCLHLDPQSRPTMAEVVTKLEQLQQNARGSCNQTSPPIARNQTPPTIATFSSCPPPSTKKLRSHAWRDTSYPTYC